MPRYNMNKGNALLNSTNEDYLKEKTNESKHASACLNLKFQNSKMAYINGS
ncbi:hypothetical protein T11_14333 [Trichinella zimbabwensis]|uniref:Uncharacterized protein n=1 Tax=Trichinella zimbabwensis TaxID=268475 RepID=A0A0V1E1I9_9BILA|nr:hypothetical protein T11_14333 [Trichinella zimbabwensis]